MLLIGLQVRLSKVSRHIARDSTGTGSWVSCIMILVSLGQEEGRERGLIRVYWLMHNRLWWEVFVLIVSQQYEDATAATGALSSGFYWPKIITFITFFFKMLWFWARVWKSLLFERSVVPAKSCMYLEKNISFWSVQFCFILIYAMAVGANVLATINRTMYKRCRWFLQFGAAVVNFFNL